jgi:hypothetical protein
MSTQSYYLGRSRLKRSLDNRLRPTIDIYTNLNTDPPSSRLAILSLDTGSDLSLISKTLVNEVLGLEIHLFDKEGNTAEDRLAIVDRCQVRLQGYVDIQWSITSAPRKMYTTRFLVPDVENPSFDVVLSQQSVQEYGLVKSSSLRRG